MLAREMWIEYEGTQRYSHQGSNPNLGGGRGGFDGLLLGAQIWQSQASPGELGMDVYVNQVGTIPGLHFSTFLFSFFVRIILSDHHLRNINLVLYGPGHVSSTYFIVYTGWWGFGSTLSTRIPGLSSTSYLSTVSSSGQQLRFTWNYTLV